MIYVSIVAPYLFHYGTEEQKHKYLPTMTTGETISCIGMTEPSGGSDLAALKTTAKRGHGSIAYTVILADHS